MLLAHYFAPKLIARGRGGIVLTGSIEGYVAFPYSTAYAATKAFVMSLGEGLWGELRACGVDVLVLTPGATDTAAPVLQGIDRSQLVGLMPPSEVARRALDALGHKPLLTTGLGNRAFMGVLRALPRSVATRLTGAGMRTAIERSKRAKAAART
jgi:short-subunit dehydrogenase